MNEADTCRKLVLPKLVASGWDNDPRSFTEQRTFTDGRIVVTGNKVRRLAQKRADYILRYTRDFPLAVVEAKDKGERLRKEKKDFFDQFGPQARAILETLLEKYAEHGTAQFIIPDVLKVPPILEQGNVVEIVQLFGGAERLREAVNRLQTLLYVA
ncbi:MAG: type I restriction-modification enzyme R subunit C-terminal domain-containing protein [Planctomycetota bacterium]